jgi:serine/threonine-protein kinase
MADMLDRLQSALAGRYTIERELGRGGMAIVYLADDRKHERKVALKVLRPELAATVGTQRFVREIEIAAKLDHPHILPLYDSGDAAGFAFYVMPHVEGESLRDRLDREKQLPVDEAIRIAREVADALTHAHARGVVHRDIKPENILMAGGHARVADFGIARAVAAAGDERLTETGFAVGTPAYMSPEQAAGTADVDARSDIYSLGCVVYEMLGGDPPFVGTTPHAVISRHALDPVPSLKTVRASIPDSLRLAVERALAKVPADRFMTAADFGAALERGWREPETKRRVFPLTKVAAATVVGVALALLVWQFAPRRTAESGVAAPYPATRIAVLYFDDHSESGRLAHVAAGLTEGLIHELAQVEALEVVSRNGVKPYRESAVPLDSIVRVLEVGTIVEGSIAESGNRLRLTVQLVDALSDTHLGSRVLEAQLTDLFALQDTLAITVSEFLRERLGREVRLRERRAGTTSVEAWELVELAERQRDEGLAWTSDGDTVAALAALGAADSLLARAERLDSRWVEPILLRGWVTEARADLGRPVPGSLDTVWLAVGMAHANRALEIQADHAGAFELRGTLLSRLADRQAQANAPSLLAQAEADLRRSVELDPDLAGAWATLSDLLRVNARFAEAKAAAERALETDAFLRNASVVTFNLYQTSLDLDQVEEAERWCAEGQRRFAGSDWTAACRLFLGALGEGPRLAPDSATILYERLLAWSSPSERRVNEPIGYMWMAAVMVRAGLRDSAEALVEVARSEASEGLMPWIDYLDANVRLLLGDRDAALDRLESFLDAIPQRKAYVASDWMFRPLWGDPRYRALVDTTAQDP